METTIQLGKRIFLGDQVFSHGLSRSGFFNKRESKELEEYGMRLQALAKGVDLPKNDEEKVFVSEVNGEQMPTLYATKLWRKYIKALTQVKSRHGFLQSESKVQPPQPLTPPPTVDEIDSFQVELS